MASAWGDSWGSAWGDSWGAITSVAYKAVNFAGPTDYVQVPNSASLNFGSGDVSFEWWMQPTDITGSNSGLWYKGNGPFNFSGQGFEARLRGSGVFEFVRSSGNGAPSRLQALNYVAAGELVHSVLTWDSARRTLTIYKNSGLHTSAQFSAAQAADYSDSYALVIGRATDTYWQKGKVDGFLAYAKCLTHAEVEARYRSQIFCPSGAKLWLKFNDGLGTIATDSSGYANHGTLLNGPTWVDGLVDDTYPWICPDPVIPHWDAQVFVSAEKKHKKRKLTPGELLLLLG